MPATTPHPHAPPTWRAPLVAALALCLTAAALASAPSRSAGAAPEAPAQAQQCIEATNRDHVDAGRATRRVFTVRAVGSGDYLGTLFGTSAVEQTGPGEWSRVAACAPGTTTTTAPGSTTTTTEGPSDRPPLTERYTAVHETDSRLPGHTVYRPRDLGEVSDPMPIVVWGNGACRADGTMFQEFLAPLAAHGVLVIASGRPGGSGSTDSDMLIDAIDFAVAENDRQGSRYQGRLDVDSISAMGQSCGGLEAIDASRDPRVGSTILWNSGIFTSGGIGGVRKDALNRLHSPVAWLNGGPSDIAYSNAVDDYERVPSSVPAVFGAYGDVGHSAMFTNPAIEREIIGVAADWLDATLYDDATARAQFVGSNCGLCSGTEWAMRSKNWS